MVASEISKSNSSPRATILLVKKPDSYFRLYVNCRALNKVNVKNRCPPTLLTELREKVDMARVFTKLGFKNVCLLVRVAEEDQEKTAFYTRFALCY